MPPLKATPAHEINKADITEAETLVFEGRVLKQTGKQSMQPGEFYFRPTAVPVTTTPGFWARLDYASFLKARRGEARRGEARRGEARRHVASPRQRVPQ